MTLDLQRSFESISLQLFFTLHLNYFSAQFKKPIKDAFHLSNRFDFLQIRTSTFPEVFNSPETASPIESYLSNSQTQQTKDLVSFSTMESAIEAALFAIKGIIRLTSEMHGSEEEVRRIGTKTEQLSSILQILKSTATKYVLPEYELLSWLRNLRICNESLSKLQNMVWHYTRGGNMAKKFARSFMYATLDKKELEKLFTEFAKSLEYFDRFNSL